MAPRILQIALLYLVSLSSVSLGQDISALLVTADESGAQGALNRALAIQPASDSDRLLQKEARVLLESL